MICFWKWLTIWKLGGQYRQHVLGGNRLNYYFFFFFKLPSFEIYLDVDRQLIVLQIS